MQRIAHPFGLHLLYQEAYRLHHHHRVRGFNGDNDVLEGLAPTDAKELHATLDDSFGRVAVTTHDAVGKRTVVHSDANSRALLAADTQEGHKASLDFLDFLGIFLVGIFQLLESSPRIDVVARIDAHLFGIPSSHVGHVGIEVHVGHQRRVVALLSKSRTDVAKILGLAFPLRGEPNEFSSGTNDAFGLLHTGVGIVGVGSGHRLNPDGMIAAEAEFSDDGRRGGPAMEGEKVGHRVSSF